MPFIRYILKQGATRKTGILFAFLGCCSVRLTQKSAAEAGATRTSEPRRYSVLFHYEKIVYMSMKQKTVQ